jgi:heat shock protein HtpX
MNQVKTIILLTALAALLVVLGGAIGGKNGATIALVIALIMNVGSYWFSDRIVLSMYNAQEITESDDPTLYHLVQQLAYKAGLPMPRLYVIPEDAPNAFATGRDPEHAAVAVTVGIMRLLSYEELAGVIGHELGHVKNRDILIQTVAATIGAAITYLAHFGMFFGGRSDDEEGGGGSLIGTLMMVILAPLAATIIQLAISRSREYLADSTGANICGHPLWLAAALNKLEQGASTIPMHQGDQATAHMFIVHPFFGQGFSSLFSTHPPIPERIARLREMAHS